MSGWKPWDGLAGQIQQPHSVVVHWVCDNGHPAQVIAVSGIELESDEIFFQPSPWTLKVERNDRVFVETECDLCPVTASMTEETLRPILTALREAYRTGRAQVVTSWNIKLLSQRPPRK